MTKEYFVILYHPNQNVYIPLMDDNGDFILFETVCKANEAGNNTVIGKTFGFEVFRIGNGE